MTSIQSSAGGGGNDGHYFYGGSGPLKSKIRILVCSSNLGNAKPDYDSLNSWIPVDGYCRYIPGLPNQRYKKEQDQVPKYKVMLESPPPPPKRVRKPVKKPIKKKKKQTSTTAEEAPNSSPRELEIRLDDVQLRQQDTNNPAKANVVDEAPNDAMLDAAKSMVQVLQGIDLKEQEGSLGDSYTRFIQGQTEKTRERTETTSGDVPGELAPEEEDEELGDGSDYYYEDDYEAFLAAFNNETAIIGDDPYAPPQGEDYEAFLANAAAQAVQLGDDPYAPPMETAAVPLGDDPYAVPTEVTPVELGDDPYAAPMENAPVELGDDPYAPPMAGEDDYEAFLAAQGQEESGAVGVAEGSGVVLGDDPYAPSAAGQQEDDYEAFLAQQQQESSVQTDPSNTESSAIAKIDTVAVGDPTSAVPVDSAFSGGFETQPLSSETESGFSEGNFAAFDDAPAFATAFPATEDNEITFAATFPPSTDGSDNKKAETADDDDPFFDNTPSTRNKIIDQLAFDDDDIAVEDVKTVEEEDDKEQFDIIIIGMQEATFETERTEEQHVFDEEDGGDDEDQKTAGSLDWTTDDGSFRSDDSLDMSDDRVGDRGEQPPPKTAGKKGVTSNKKGVSGDSSSTTSATTNTTTSSTATVAAATSPGNSVISPPESGGSSKKNKLNKVFGQAGKATLKLGKLGLKAGKKVVKTGKTAKTLVTSKDHTKEAIPTPQQAMAPIMDGGLSDWSDTTQLHYLLEEQLPSYKRAVSYQQGEMRLIMYYKESAINLDVLSVKAQNTGKGGLANKGGIVAEVSVNDTTRLAFATAHLEAHEGREKYATRCSSVSTILRGTESTSAGCKCDASMANHFMFFMGDLNFRTRLSKYEPGSDEHVEITHRLVGSKTFLEEKQRKLQKEKQSEATDSAVTANKNNDHSETEIPDDPPASCYYPLNAADELAHALRIKDCFVGFQTPYCNFPPTFKVGRQHGYKYNPKRSPSYTDRILYKTSDQLDAFLTPILYEPVVDFTSSDHKPIRGAFDIDLNPKLRWKPILSGKEGAKGALFGKGNKSKDMISESLCILISYIKCEISPAEFFKTRGKVESPNPFVCFMSTPREALQTGTSTWENMFKKVGIHTLKTTKTKVKGNKGHEEDVEVRSFMGWPRNKKMTNTFAPEWGAGEEIQFKIRTHQPNGAPIDLSGAMLHLALMDHQGGAEPRLVGSFTLNLAMLLAMSSNRADEIGKSKQRYDNIEATGWSRQGDDALIESKEANNETTEEGTKSSKEKKKDITISSKGSRSRSKRKTASDTLGKKIDALCLELDEPLVEGGVEVGRIACTVDTWMEADVHESG